MTRYEDRRFVQRAERFHRGHPLRITDGQGDVPVLARCDADSSIHLLTGYARGLVERRVRHPAEAGKLLGRIIRRWVTGPANRTAQLRRLSAFERGLARDQDFARSYCPSQLLLLGCDMLIDSIDSTARLQRQGHAAKRAGGDGVDAAARGGERRVGDRRRR